MDLCVADGFLRKKPCFINGYSVVYVEEKDLYVGFTQFEESYVYSSLWHLNREKAFCKKIEFLAFFVTVIRRYSCTSRTIKY